MIKFTVRSTTYVGSKSHFRGSGFTVSLYEYEATIPTLWQTVKGTGYNPAHRTLDSPVCSEFIQENPDVVVNDNAMAFISDDGGDTFNKCHCRFSLLLFGHRRH
jgi:hypothetical protein